LKISGCGTQIEDRKNTVSSLTTRAPIPHWW